MKYICVLINMRTNKIIAVFCCAVLGLTTDLLESSCTPNASINTIGAHPFNMDPGKIGTSYSDTLTIVMPKDTLINIPGIGNVTIPFDSLEILSVLNLAVGLNKECVNSICTYKKPVSGPLKGCVRIFGTPSTKPTNDTILVNLRLWLTVLGTPTNIPFTLKAKLTISTLSSINDLGGFNKVNAFPNPFTKSILVRPSFEMDNANIEVINVYGQVVFSKSSIKGLQYEIEDMGIPSGTYILQVKQNGMISRTKILKQ